MTSRNPDDYELLQQQSRSSAGRVDAYHARCGDRAPFLLEEKRPFGGLRWGGAHPRVRALLFAVALLAVGASVAAVLPAAGRRGPPHSGGEPPGADDAVLLDKIVNVGDEIAPDAPLAGKAGQAPEESSAPPEQQQQDLLDTPFQALATASETATLASPPYPGPHTIRSANTLSASSDSPQATEFSLASMTADDSVASSATASSSVGGCATGITCDGVDAGGVSAPAASDSDVESTPVSFDPNDVAATSASASGDPAFLPEAETPSDPAMAGSAGDLYYEQVGECAAGTPCDAVDAVGMPTLVTPGDDIESSASFDHFDPATVTSTADDSANTTEAASSSTPPATTPVFEDEFYELEGECADGIPCDGVDTGDMSTSAVPDGDAESPTSRNPSDAVTVTSTSDAPTYTTKAAAPNDPPVVIQPAGDVYYELSRVDDNSDGAGSVSEESPPDASTAAPATTAAGRDSGANSTGVAAAGEITGIQPSASSDATQTRAAVPDTGESQTDETAGGDTAQPLLSAPPEETTDDGAGDSVVGGEGEIIEAPLPSTGAVPPEIPNAEGGTETGDVAAPATEPSPSSDDLGGGASAEAAELLADGGFF